MDQFWGKMSCSVGKQLVCLAFPVTGTSGKACVFLGRSQFQRLTILTWVAGTQWHLGRELKPSQARAEGCTML